MSRLQRLVARWPHAALALSLVLFLLVLFTAIPLSLPSKRYDFCLPDGSPSPNGLGVGEVSNARNPLSRSYFFTINIAFGSMGFSTAKFIDVAWDVTIGRGGQLLLGYLAYHVMSLFLLRSLERTVVPYRLFVAMSIEPVSLHSFSVLCRELFQHRAWMGFRLGAVTFITAYILSFPTLMAAMTGYTTRWTPYIKQDDGSLILLSHYDIVEYIIVDGERVGLQNDTFVYAHENFVGERPGYYSEELRLSVEKYVEESCGSGCPTGGKDPLHYYRTDRDGGMRTPLEGGGLMVKGTNRTLEKPTLNITAVSAGENPTQGQNGYLDREPRSITQMAKNLRCLPSAEYQWGFSYLLLFIIAIINTIWVTVLFSLWREASGLTPGGRFGGPLGKYRAAVDLSMAFANELGREGADGASEEALEEVVTKSANGLHLQDTGLCVASARRGKSPYNPISNVEKGARVSVFG